MVVNYCFQVFSDLDAISVEDFVEAAVFSKMLISRFKNGLPIFVDTFLLKGALKQIIFILWLRLL